MPFAQGVSSKAPHGLISIQGATIGLYTNCQGYYSRHDKQCIFYRHAELFFSSSLWLLNTFKQGIQSKQIYFRSPIFSTYFKTNKQKRHLLNKLFYIGPLE